MADWRSVTIDIKEAELLADLAGIHDDLEATDAICDLLSEGIKEKPGKYCLTEALSSAAVVRYARVFTEGVRAKKLRNELKTSISPELLEKHEWFMNLRSRHIAHSVNAYENNQVIAFLVPEERGPKAISSISFTRMRLLGLGGEDIFDLKALCRELIKHVGELIEREKVKVLEVAKQLPIEQLYSQKNTYRRFPRKNDVQKSRKRK